METNYNEALIQDSQFLLEMCPDPPFSQNSNEQSLAQKWLDYLCTYQVEDLNDRRLKNIYISHLCAALVQRQLYGPFVREPNKGKLEKVDFQAVVLCPNSSIVEQQEKAHSTMQHPVRETTTQNLTTSMNASQPSVCSPQQPSSYTVVNATKTLNSTGFESQGQISVGSTNLSFNVTSGVPSTACACPPKPCQCSANGIPCSCNRFTAGADTKSRVDEEAICNYLMQQLNLTPDFLTEFDATLTSFMDLCKVASLECQTRNQSQTNSKSQMSLQTLKHDFLPKSQTLQHEANLQPRTPPPEYEEMNGDINELLEAIMAELRGDAEPGSNDYLDHELSRYRSFVMANSHLASHLSSLTLNTKLRNCLLLLMQNDLVKLLSEEVS